MRVRVRPPPGLSQEREEHVNDWKNPIIVKDRTELGQWWSERTPLKKAFGGS